MPTADADLSTFAKVRALHDRTTNPGEKAAAAGRMKRLAAKAGLTVAEALSKLDAPAPPPAPRSIFEDLFNTPEFRARNSEYERKRAERRAAALAEFGSEDAIFADTDREAALRAAFAPLLTWDTQPGWESVYRIPNWPDHGGKGSMPPEIGEAAKNGWPMPETVAAAWAEYQSAEAIEDARYAFCGDYTPHRWVEARSYVLEDMLDTHPARSLNDLRARMSWLEFLSRKESSWTHEGDLIRFATLRADIERMGARLREQDAVPVQDGQDGEGAAPTAHPLNSPDPADQSTVQNGQPLSSPDLGRSNAGVQSGHLSPAASEFYEDVVKPDLGPAAIQDGQAWKYPPGGHFARRTNADKRRDVLALLNMGEAHNSPLTDREIARRAGVSPTTVGTIRRAQAARAVSP